MQRLIDADAVIEVQMYDEEKEAFYTEKMTVEDYICRYSEMPSIVDAEPVRHGKFIGTEYDGYADGNPVYYEWKCSECGCVFEEEEPTYRYCPNCGADMRGESE